MSTVAHYLHHSFYVHRDRGAPPPQRLCPAQAALLSGVPPMTSLASLALVCSVGGCPTFIQGQASSRRRFYRAATLAAPYTAFAVFTAVCAKLGAAHPDEVIRPPHALSCTIDLLPFNAIVAAFATAVSLASVVLFAIKVVLLWREGGDGSSIENEKHSMSDVDSEGDPNWQLLVRAGMLALCMLGISIVGLVDIVSSARRDVLDVLRAVAAMAVFIIFGTHPVRVSSTLAVPSSIFSFAHMCDYKGIFGICLRRGTSEPAMHSSSQTLARATPPPSPSPSPTLAFDPTQGLPFDPALPPVPLLPYDQALLFGPTLTDTDRKRVDSATSAKSARLHAARGAGVQIIERPQDAFGRKGTGWGKGASPAASLFEYSVRSREGIGGDETKL
ncbi:hypothetical protein WOLCODRAFT_150088 [Wolfiporia cocos MD-104 SS10]|uniref:Uncharacterized protein n=1 Tax=Wolfiporia cocos (strain MD-104) TaxID=742152 RepID=A0A2H3JQK8_WOLCO|nr:hypothetical protein WOLCODRAFT_150088 [Wolfiporia cocos MD-104 SS10]